MTPPDTHAPIGPQLPGVAMHLHTPTEPGEAVVVESSRCTKGRKASAIVRHIVLDISGTRLAGNFRAGQSFGVMPPGLDARGKPHKVRLYSIASPTTGEDGQGRHLSTTVKRTIDEHWETHALFLGIASNWLCDLRPGDKVPVTGPGGKRFLLPADPGAHDYVFVATGTGIAPFRGMVRELLRVAPTPRIALIMGVPYDTDLLYDEEFASTRSPSFTYLTALSRQPQPDADRPMYVQDRLYAHADLIRSILAGDRGLLYVCGLAGMELGVLRALSQVLPGEALAQYLRVGPDAPAPDAWTRAMIHRQVAPTRRVFMEVY